MYVMCISKEVCMRLVGRGREWKATCGEEKGEKGGYSHSTYHGRKGEQGRGKRIAGRGAGDAGRHEVFSRDPIHLPLFTPSSSHGLALGEGRRSWGGERRGEGRRQGRIAQLPFTKRSHQRLVSPSAGQRSDSPLHAFPLRLPEQTHADSNKALPGSSPPHRCSQCFGHSQYRATKLLRTERDKNRLTTKVYRRK